MWKDDPSFFHIQETHTNIKDGHHDMVQENVQRYSKQMDPRRSWYNIATLLSDKTDFKPKLIRRDKKGY